MQEKVSEIKLPFSDEFGKSLRRLLLVESRIFIRCLDAKKRWKRVFFFVPLPRPHDRTQLVENIFLTFLRGEAGRVLGGYFLPLHIGTVLSAAGHIGNVGSACFPVLPPGRDQQLRTF